MLREPLSQTPHPTILLAEDDLDQSEILKDILESEGYQVDTTFSGEKALHKLQTHVYDLAILDVRMPGMNGSEVLRHYRQAEGVGHMPIIVVSAFATEPQMRQYRSAGADQSFSKPYELQELLSGIRGLMTEKKTNGDGLHELRHGLQ